ncbi:hypothetical protein A2852_02530 [Candidatus Adlerbacteria bacterium RIFCSPHIGHO2_01_FULL_54_23]|uniref:DUF5671 domain-containing protein n=3 Tax=Candidatus Adleribacteriota TaxID=1752736 RepID=A0A1F4Y0V9_9BACT|nr:MAG: hypothetical protein UY83_C0002G0020 [Candidatus Adlerbacteria bacterium GW2011_GWA1_54_10]KKW37995.1 MAG: hypothetical protein UY86_C0002G0092 [Candidatus Adlerbacteria bacterium GW2011_GWB1_54_7]OGC78602.1 MAG: hypothetical protein A2852_02530 [Candidatus Adlerbacteria bacterium RIFCSPHIGHO2_01_FULL_54_23]OGC87610.1 MAG: hypothetical protein A3B33_01725 [Candidatus Adlerbacteria bacterium RIFCSPLOWO2_01_FULL_54_16]
MDKPKITPKDFFLWVGAMATLYGGVVAFIALLFNYVDTIFPNMLRQYSYDPYQSGMSYEMAALIVLAPVFLALMRFIRRDIAHDPARKEIWLRRWVLFLTIFVAGATMIIDLIVLLTSFLRGEDITAGFVLKVLIVFLVAGAGFLHFVADLRGYWERQPNRARAVNYGVGVLVLVAIVAGFFIVGTPQQQRLYRFDEQKIADLQQIQSQVVYYWQQKQKLPAALTDLQDPLSYFTLPRDPQGEEYKYRATGPRAFELCATFNKESRNSNSAAKPVMYNGLNENWQHTAGEACFERTIDPDLYPPAVKGRI